MFVPKWQLLAATGRIRLADEGGDGGGSTSTSTSTSTQDGGEQQTAPKPGPPANAQAQTTSETSTDWDGKVESLPDGAQDLIKSLRTENASDRTGAKTKAADDARNSLIQDLGKALGLVNDGDEAPTAEQLAQQATDAQSAAKQSAIELAVYRTAKDHGGNPAALTDSRAFLTKVTDLDPTAEDFTTRVTKAATDAVTANPSLKAVQVTGASSVDHSGGSGEKPKQPASLVDAVNDEYTKRT